MGQQLTGLLQLTNRLQSNFCAHHSTEMALVKIKADLFMVSDSGLLSVLVQLDFSAAFDTADHNVSEHAAGNKVLHCSDLNH